MAERRGIREDELLVERSKVGHLHDLLYLLEAACEDVVADLEEEGTDLRQAIDHLLTTAAPLRAAYLEPKADLHG